MTRPHFALVAVLLLLLLTLVASHFFSQKIHVKVTRALEISALSLSLSLSL